MRGKVRARVHALHNKRPYRSINMIAYFLAGAAGLWVWMDATPTGRKVKTSLPFIRINY